MTFNDSRSDNTHTIFDSLSYIEPYQKSYQSSGVINIKSSNPEKTVLKLQELIYDVAEHRAQFRDPFVVSPINDAFDTEKKFDNF